MNTDYRKYLKLLAEKYPSQQAVCREIINLNAILNLPKGTEHFMSDLHGEYEAFYHIVNNCSGVIREKIQMIFEDEMTEAERRDLATLVYYPRRKMALLKRHGKITDVVSDDLKSSDLHRPFSVRQVHQVQGPQGHVAGLRLHH